MFEKINFNPESQEFKDNLDKIQGLVKQMSADSQKKMKSSASFESVELPETVTFVNVVNKTTEINGENVTFSEFITDKGAKYSVNRIFDLAYNGKKDTLKFKPSRAGSSLKGAGVLEGSKPVNPQLMKFAAQYGLSREKLVAALLGVPLKAERETFYTYYPDVPDGEKIPFADELNEKLMNGKTIPGLNAVDKYILTFDETVKPTEPTE